MTRPTRIEVNCTTGETSIIELTDAEIAANEAAAAAHEAQRLEQEAAQSAVEAARASANEKLAGLGLTAEEISALTK
jgi:hypothetical protein